MPASGKHHPYATSLTRTGKPDMTNRKPFRTKEQKAAAREAAFVRNGTYVSHSPVSYHREQRGRAT